MNKTMTIAVIALVAVVMGMSAVVPNMNAYASHTPGTGECPGNFKHIDAGATWDDFDRNENGSVCTITITTPNGIRHIITIDDIRT